MEDRLYFATSKDKEGLTVYSYVLAPTKDKAIDKFEIEHPHLNLIKIKCLSPNKKNQEKIDEIIRRKQNGRITRTH